MKVLDVDSSSTELELTKKMLRNSSFFARQISELNLQGSTMKREPFKMTKTRVGIYGLTIIVACTGMLSLVKTIQFKKSEDTEATKTFDESMFSSESSAHAESNKTAKKFKTVKLSDKTLQLISEPKQIVDGSNPIRQKILSSTQDDEEVENLYKKLRENYRSSKLKSIDEVRCIKEFCRIELTYAGGINDVDPELQQLDGIYAMTGNTYPSYDVDEDTNSTKVSLAFGRMDGWDTDFQKTRK